MASAKEACQALGEGWRLPKFEDWRDFFHDFGGAVSPDEKTVNASRVLLQAGKGFKAKCGGGYNPLDKRFYFYWECGYYWSNSKNKNGETLYAVFECEHIPRFSFRARNAEEMVLSCRCVKDIF